MSIVRLIYVTVKTDQFGMRSAFGKSIVRR
jgi:hypothetical protein